MRIAPIFGRGRLALRGCTPFRRPYIGRAISLDSKQASLHNPSINLQRRSFCRSTVSSMSSKVTQDDLVGLGGTTDLPTRNGNHEMPQTAWSGPGPAAFDFRSTPHQAPSSKRQRLMQTRRCSDDPHAIYAGSRAEHHSPRRRLPGRPHDQQPRGAHGIPDRARGRLIRPLRHNGEPACPPIAPDTAAALGALRLQGTHSLLGSRRRGDALRSAGQWSRAG